MSKENIVKTALSNAISRAGNQTKLAKAVGTKPQNVSYWLKVGKVSREFVIPISSKTGIPCSELAPDIYPPEEYQKAS